MLISYTWLRELTDTTLTPLELRERLTMVGLAIDDVERHQDDSILDVEVPSNRPDCLSHIGIAREVLVIDPGTLRLPQPRPQRVEGRVEDLTSVDIQDEELCPRYAARLVRGVTIGPSPDWLVKRLEAIGQRSINNVADITNYVLHETGQPLHAFDFAKLSDFRIVVRRASNGEKLVTLDGVERELNSEMLVIADAEKPVALAGIMGGEDSEISTITKDVLIESAYFNPDSVRRTARLLGMDTEASRRFERGADCENVLHAQQRCVDLICEVAGGLPTEGALDIYPRPFIPRTVKLRPDRVRELTSLDVDPVNIKRILSGLGFIEQVANHDGVQYLVPSWRVDVEQEEDLVEEVARHTGYDKISSQLPPATTAGEYQPDEMKRRLLRRTLNGFGFDEAINFSFIESDDQFELIPAFEKQGVKGRQPTLKNPIIEGMAQMRASLLPGLLGSIRHNLNHGIRDVSLFEIGRVFAAFPGDKLSEERDSLSLIATGGISEGGRAQTTRESDFYDLKGALESAIAAMNLGPLLFEASAIRHLQPGQSARIMLAQDNPIGSIGRLVDSISTRYKFRQAVWVAELDLTILLRSAERLVQYQPLPRYPSVVRDVTLQVARSVSADSLLRAVQALAVEDCRGARLVGTYEGAGVPADKRSITLRIEYRSADRTLRDEEIEERQQKLVDALCATFSAEQH
ncbi:MAG TPA: phenylalanine--tRNA ligase subunit beta [Pyrinomonadaceae bacterium]